MKKFRLLTLLAIIATISTSFAAWTYYNYAAQDDDTSAKFTLSVPDTTVTGGEAIDIEITSASMPTVTFTQNATDMEAVDATVNGDVTVKVTEKAPDAIDAYNYYYVVYYEENPGYLDLEPLSTYETDGDVIVSTVQNNVLNVAEDGTATITAANLAEFFKVDTKITGDDAAAFSGCLINFQNVMNNADAYLKVYAVKK